MRVKNLRRIIEDKKEWRKFMKKQSSVLIEETNRMKLLILHDRFNELHCVQPHFFGNVLLVYIRVGIKYLSPCKGLVEFNE